MATATLSSKSQIVVPAEVRASLGLAPGDQLSIVVEGDHAVLRKQPGSALEPARFSGAMADIEASRDAWPSS